MRIKIEIATHIKIGIGLNFTSKAEACVRNRVIGVHHIRNLIG